MFSKTVFILPTLKYSVTLLSNAIQESMKSESQSVTCTELEAEAHDDDDVYHACGHEQPEEEVLTEDDFVDVETHNDNMGAGVGETMDTADTQPLETQLQDSQPQDSQALDTQPMEGIGGDELNSEDEKKGARKVGSSHVFPYTLLQFSLILPNSVCRPECFMMFDWSRLQHV